jgi:hypothetical protein
MSYWKEAIWVGKRNEIVGHWQTEFRKPGIAKSKIDILVSELFCAFCSFSTLCDHPLFVGIWGHSTGVWI